MKLFEKCYLRMQFYNFLTRLFFLTKIVYERGNKVTVLSLCVDTNIVLNCKS